jgi:hypothetical protein
MMVVLACTVSVEFDTRTQGLWCFCDAIALLRDNCRGVFSKLSGTACNSL